MAINEILQPGNIEQDQTKIDQDNRVEEENIKEMGIKKYIALTILIIVIALLIPSLYPSQESIEIHIGNVAIRYHKTNQMFSNTNTQMFFDWLKGFFALTAFGNQLSHQNQQLSSAGSAIGDEVIKLLRQRGASNTPTKEESDIATQVNSLKFEKYDELNLCDVSKEIPRDQFNITVREIGDFLNLPDDLVKIIVRSEKFNDQKQSSVEPKPFKGKDEFLYFGKFVIARTKVNTVVFAYSLHGVKFTLVPRNEQPSTLSDSFISFVEKTMKCGIANDTASDYGRTEENDSFQGDTSISKEAIRGFINHYLHETYEHFINNCKGHLDVLEGIEREENKSENLNMKNLKEMKANGKK